MEGLRASPPVRVHVGSVVPLLAAAASSLPPRSHPPSIAPAVTKQPSAGAHARAYRHRIALRWSPHPRGWQGGQHPNRRRQGGIGGAAVEMAMAAGELFTRGMEEEEEPGAFPSGIAFWRSHFG